MEGQFNPETHRKDFEEAQKEVPRQLTNAHEQALKDNETFDEIRGREISYEHRRKLSEEERRFLISIIEEDMKRVGSLARLDESIDGGIVSVVFDKEKVKDRETAFRSFQEAHDNIPSSVSEIWEKVQFTPPKNTNLDIVILSYNHATHEIGTRKSLDMITEDMNKLGYRPLTLEEMVIAGIYEPRFFIEKSYQLFVGLKEYNINGTPFVPCLMSNPLSFRLDACEVGEDWENNNSFLCVRSIEGQFNPETHRKDFEEAQKEVSRQLTNAHEQALKDNETFDEIRRKEEEKQPQIKIIEEHIKEAGSFATLDKEFGNGLINIVFDKEKVKDEETAFKSLKDADNGSDMFISSTWRSGSFTPPNNTNLDIIVLSYENSPIGRASDKIIEDMNKLGYRPLTLEEMVIAGIYEPRFTKTSKLYIALQSPLYDSISGDIDGNYVVPFLGSTVGVRELGEIMMESAISHTSFLCVRK